MAQFRQCQSTSSPAPLHAGEKRAGAEPLGTRDTRAAPGRHSNGPSLRGARAVAGAKLTPLAPSPSRDDRGGRAPSVAGSLPGALPRPRPPRPGEHPRTTSPTRAAPAADSSEPSSPTLYAHVRPPGRAGLVPAPSAAQRPLRGSGSRASAARAQRSLDAERGAASRGWTVRSASGGHSAEGAKRLCAGGAHFKPPSVTTALSRVPTTRAAVDRTNHSQQGQAVSISHRRDSRA